MNLTVTGKVADSIKKASEELTRKKLALAEAFLVVERAKLETQVAESELIKLTHKAAKTLGIDANNPSKGRWHFDPSTLTFTEVPSA